MNDWMRVRWKVMAGEILSLCALIGFIVIGVCWQLSSNSVFEIVFENIDKDFALVILQIQATVDTLTISIIALISGSVSDCNMGIVFTDYYLNIRPIIFKQKRIIISSLLLLVINIGFYIAECYCLVLWIFAGTIVLILMSINEIYLIFNGKRLAERETKENGSAESNKLYFKC